MVFLSNAAVLVLTAHLNRIGLMYHSIGCVTNECGFFYKRKRSLATHLFHSDLAALCAQ